MYNVNSKLQLYQEKKSGDTSQRLKKKWDYQCGFQWKGTRTFVLVQCNTWPAANCPPPLPPRPGRRLQVDIMQVFSTLGKRLLHPLALLFYIYCYLPSQVAIQAKALIVECNPFYFMQLFQALVSTIRIRLRILEFQIPLNSFHFNAIKTDSTLTLTKLNQFK